MFTGLIEDLGRVKKIGFHQSGGNLTVETSLQGIKIGDSVSVNGVCLTATTIKGNLVTFDLSKETLDKSNLKLLKVGDRVNLERALTPSKPLGGHIVLGHVDTVGVIKELQALGEHHRLIITFEEKYLPLVVEKGSIAVDGISLTINKVLPLGVEINVIPHTFKVTNLRFRKKGDFVNLEFDIFGKYVMRYLDRLLRKEKLLKEFFNL
ncbi:MAG TPA: riboflavin synthase [Aquifex aeolicus]|uniref:Riboflavin synthase n=1 Tax=Aquifex aeolicus TaxID=63363 RepID=A0A9D1CFD9_AQUAO|nr:riboflavin synthase [Aquificales bacterium]HIP86014.1 riboflavin synthase [Aquifex sp.]HIP98785.1 riboflavin synthase [Aquifex aeolicus]HIQ26714.1 riboflavin synthase [Aquifex aeolicus]